jgi:hypothetical protein
MVSCKKQETLKPSSPTETFVQQSSNAAAAATVKYYLDNSVVATVNFNDPNLNTIINKEADGSTGVYAYTTLNGYLNKGTVLGHNLAIGIQIENDLKNYANSIGAIDLYDRTGQIDTRYTIFEQNYIATSPALQKNSTNSVIGINGIWYDNPYPSKPSTAYPPISAFMWFGAWQNRVSGFRSIWIYGVDFLYKRTMFRSRLATFTGWGDSEVFFNLAPFQFLDNNTKSWLSFHI